MKLESHEKRLGKETFYGRSLMITIENFRKKIAVQNTNYTTV